MNEWQIMDLDPLPGEMWKVLEDWPKYQVSNLGRVLGAKCYILKQAPHGGYLSVRIGPRNSVYKDVHVLVCTAFNGPKPDPKWCVAHNDGVKYNNHATNLRWDTLSNNSKDRIKHGTLAVGEDHRWAKLSNMEAANIRARYDLGERASSIAKDYPQVAWQTVYQIARRLIRKTY